LVICGLLLGLGLAPATFAQTPDNTKVNERDRDKSQPTADQAKNGQTDSSVDRPDGVYLRVGAADAGRGLFRAGSPRLGPAA
jgi:hypothetical protein